MTVAVDPATASQPKPVIRRAQPASTTGRGPYRSVSAPPTTKRPCWLKVRSPRTSPTSQPAMPRPLPRWVAR